MSGLRKQLQNVADQGETKGNRAQVETPFDDVVEKFTRIYVRVGRFFHTAMIAQVTP